MKYILTWTKDDTMYIQRYTDFSAACAAYMRLSCDVAIAEGWLDEYNENGQMIQDWFFSHN